MAKGWLFPDDPGEELPMPEVKEEAFNGPVYEAKFDYDRLAGQIKRVHGLMLDGVWRTLNEIANLTGDPPASISAQLRHLRKERFGSHVIEKRARGERSRGLWEYRLVKGVPD